MKENYCIRMRIYRFFLNGIYECIRRVNITYVSILSTFSLDLQASAEQNQFSIVHAYICAVKSLTAIFICMVCHDFIIMHFLLLSFQIIDLPRELPIYAQISILSHLYLSWQKTNPIIKKNIYF